MILRVVYQDDLGIVVFIVVVVHAQGYRPGLGGWGYGRCVHRVGKFVDEGKEVGAIAGHVGPFVLTVMQ